MSAHHEDEPLVGEALAKAIDSTPWPELTGDADASAFADRISGRWPEKWAGGEWHVGEYLLREDDLRSAYQVIKAGGSPEEVRKRLARELRDNYGSRYVDRALQLLSKEGLIRFNREKRVWRAV